MVIERAIAKSGNEKRETGKVLSVEAVDALVTYAQGDGRRVLNALEAVLDHVTHVSRVPFPVSREAVLSVLERPLPAYDKSGEQHFNLISALPIERALHVRPANGFVQGGDEVEVLLAGLVVGGVGLFGDRKNKIR